MPRRWAALACLFLTACASGDAEVDAERASVPPPTLATTTTERPTTTTSTTTPSTAPPTTPVAADACPPPIDRRAPDPDRPRYDLELSADPRSGQVTGIQEVAFVPDLPVDTVVFRLWANGPRPASVGSSITVSTVREGGADRTVARPDPTTAVVQLGRRVPAGERIALRLDWQLQVGGPVNDRISRQQESLRLGSFVPLLAWQPGLGWATEPATSGFAESTTSPTADWRYTVRVPDGFGVVATGDVAADGAHTADAARDIAVAVGRFTTASAVARAPDPVAVSVSVHDGIDDPARYLGQVVSQLEELSRRYGPYPWPSYDLSVTPDLSGGIEFPMHVMQGPATDDRTTPHEVAHMWFYGLVGNNQALHPWLDEGVATYAEGRLLGTLPSMAGRSIPAEGRGRAGEPMTYWESRPSAYYRSVYVQPAAALSRLPDALVDCALARYVAANAFTIATPDDFVAAFDAVFRDWRSALAPAGLP